MSRGCFRNSRLRHYEYFNVENTDSSREQGHKMDFAYTQMCEYEAQEEMNTNMNVQVNNWPF